MRLHGGVRLAFVAIGLLALLGFQGTHSARNVHAAGGFTPTGSLLAARTDHTATLLSDGRVLIVGGQDHRGPVATAEIYDPATVRFTATGSLNVARSRHGAALLPNGDVLIAGGYADSGGFDPAPVERYNAASGTFTRIGNPDAFVQARIFPSVTALADGRVLIAGGYNGTAFTAAQLFDPTNNSVTDTAGPLLAARLQHSAVRLKDGTVLIRRREGRRRLSGDRRDLRSGDRPVQRRR